MVDAAIGGKTGVNTRFGKNMLGTFYPADHVFIDPTLLDSLPQSQWTNGAAEVIKYALIRSLPLYEMLKKWDPKDSAYLETILHACVLIKAEIVEKDFEEKTGLRRILNFGHTIAHGLELLEDYHLPHGEAVAIGMLVESYLSMQMGYLPLKIFQEIETMIRSFAFSLKLSTPPSLENLYLALARDKKSLKGTVRFVLLENIGTCHPFNGDYCVEVPKQILDEALTWMIAQFSGERGNCKTRFGDQI
jgi:3-dehydroquinate synthase